MFHINFHHELDISGVMTSDGIQNVPRPVQVSTFFSVFVVMTGKDRVTW